jgi:hypothetical protein
MEGSPDDVADAPILRARVTELEQELLLRVGDVSRLDRELRHARADVIVKDEFIASLNLEADKLQRIRDLLGKVPFGSHAAQALEGQLRVESSPRPALAARIRITYSTATRRARSIAGRLKRRVMGSDHLGS